MRHSRRLAALVFVFLACIPGLARAEDIVWTYVVPYTLYTGHGSDVYFYMSNIITTVAYHVFAEDDATQSSICDASIPVGTKVRIGFVPHQYEDIYWFGSGAAYDSPYGDWIAGAARPANLCQEKNFAYFQPAWRWTPRNHYISLAIDPPVQTVDAPSMFDCGEPDQDGTVECTAARAGTGDVSYDIGATYGYFHKALWGDGENWCYPDRDLQANGSIYRLEVPAQQYSCPVTVAGTSGAKPPSTPTFVVAGSDSCTTGTPYTLSFSSSDPMGGRVRYGIDWNNDGLIDQITGYTPSGTAQSISRTFALTGSKVIRVRAFNEQGVASGFARHTITCAGATDASFSATRNGENAGGAKNGAGAYVSPDLTLRVIPSLVHRGDTVRVNWSALNVLSCDITAPNGDAWEGLQSIVGGNVSGAITQQTTYTLSCIDQKGAAAKKQATVNILPGWEER
jgi:hypothetical protein